MDYSDYMTEKRLQRSIDVSPDSYLDRVAHGQRSAYVRATIDTHLAELVLAVKGLTGAYSDEELDGLILMAWTPRRVYPLDIDLLPDEHRQWVYALATELDLTGLGVGELFELLREGARV